MGAAVEAAGKLAMGERLQRLRQAAGLSQSQLARAAGVPAGSLKNWEQGRRLPQLDAAYRLAKAIGVSLDELAGQVFEDGAPAKGGGGATGAAAPKRRRSGKGE
jgi:transcriptional regulator with XRE-family HTH domain